jgi:hypothetical protein
MFNKIINTIYDSFAHPSAKSKENQQQNQSSESSDQRRFSSVSAQQPDIPSLLNQNSEAPLRRASTSQVIPIGKSNTTRRRTSIFGISNKSCDDYVQKDLISSSWS